jgi:hypothetical protein
MTAWPGTSPNPSVPMTVITDNDDTAYKEDVRDLIVWCKDNNLFLNVIKTKDILMNYRKRRTEHIPILIDRLQWNRLRASSFLVSTSPTNCHGPNTQS